YPGSSPPQPSSLHYALPIYRNFQAVNPFSTVPNPAYTRVQAGIAFGGALKKDKTFYYFSYEITRRHETGFSSIGQNNFGLVPFEDRKRTRLKSSHRTISYAV